MRRVLLAAAVSVAVHAAVALAFVELAPERAVVVAEGPRPVEVEVLRLAAAELPERSRGPAPRKVEPKPRARANPPPPAAATVEAPLAEVAPSDPPPLDSARGTLADAAPPASPALTATLDTTELSRRLQAVAARCYPAAARRFRQTGEAEVRFCLDGAGALAESTVSRSSGSDLLDRAASGCVVPGAAPFGAEAHGRCFTVPVRFRQ